jgi:FPC/CPF motif-containing protein YcgG
VKSGKVIWNSQDLEAALYKQQLLTWEAEAYTSFKAKVTNKSFPCTFAIEAQRKGGLLYAFTQSPEADVDLLHMHAVMLEYLEYVSGMPQVKAAMTVLIIFIKMEGGPLSIQAYHQKAWRVLQFLHEHDPSPWPTTVPTDPNDPHWAFCFAGTALFVNINTPENHMRRSRNLGPVLTLVIQPRESFDVFAGDTPQGRRIRAFIRGRLASYDLVAPSPELGTYGDPSKREWKQYGLLDTNATGLEQCPFHTRNMTTQTEAQM